MGMFPFVWINKNKIFIEYGEKSEKYEEGMKGKINCIYKEPGFSNYLKDW